jgi:uncharacterized membrane protein YkoI
MKSKDLNKKIHHAYSNIVPDVLDSVLSDCTEQKGNVIIMTEKKKNNPWVRRCAGIAAALVILVGGAFGLQSYRAGHSVSATVSLDVNPSIEIKVNEKENVLAVTPKNEDAKVVIGDMDFKGSSLDLTVNALIGSMLRNGYLNDIANSILVSVDDNDPASGAQLQARLTEEINAMLQTDAFSGSVLSQTITASPELQELADTYGITLGKAQLIQQITAQNALYSFADLVPLSINELNLLAQSGSTQLTNVETVGTASDKAYIGEEKAKEAALAHAGASADTISKYEIEMEYEKGVMVYDIEFTADGYEYSYDINALTGDVVNYDKEWDDDVPHNSTTSPSGSTGNTSGNTGNTSGNTGNTSGNTGSDTYIGEEKAKEIAFSHAGISADSAVAPTCKLDRDDGIVVYEIEFYAGGYEYNYDIDATSGSIVEYDIDWDD